MYIYVYIHCTTRTQCIVSVYYMQIIIISRPVARLKYGGPSGPKWNSLLRKWPLWLIMFCWTDNLRLKYLDTSFISGIDGVYR